MVGAIESLATKPKVMVSQSAVGYYGNRGDETLDETSAPGKSFDASVCVEWEQAAHGVEAAGVRLVIVRTGQVMETEGGILGELLLPFKLGLGGPLAGGKQWVPWIHLSDEVGIPAWALDTESVSGVVNGTAPNPVTNKDWSKALGKALGRPAVLPIPGIAVEVKFGKEFGKVAQGGQRVLPRRTEELGYAFKFPQIDGALRDLVGQLGSKVSWTLLRTPELPADSTASMTCFMALLPEEDVSRGMPADSRIERLNLLPGPGDSSVATALVSEVARRELEPSVARSTPPQLFHSAPSIWRRS